MALSGAPTAFVGFLFGLRASKVGKEVVGQLGDWSVHATSWAGVPWSVRVQWEHWGAGNGNGLKVPMNTSTGTKSSVHANLGITCL